MNIKKHIPNFLTCCNLLCGCLGITEVFHAHLQNAAYLILLACLFDFLDGFAARLLHVTSPIGKELDSLADGVTFGVLPSMIIFQLINQTVIINSGISPLIPMYFYNLNTTIPISCMAFLISIFSALRLAKFNIDTRQSESFIGLPTPANSLLIASIPLILPSDHLQNTLFNIQSYSNTQQFLCSIYFLIGLTLLMSFLLVAELPLFALKFKHFKWAGNEIRFIFLALSILLLAFLKWLGIPIIIFLYIILSVVNNVISRKEVKPGEGTLK